MYFSDIGRNYIRENGEIVEQNDIYYKRLTVTEESLTVEDNTITEEVVDEDSLKIEEDVVQEENEITQEAKDLLKHISMTNPAKAYGEILSKTYNFNVDEQIDQAKIAMRYTKNASEDLTEQRKRAVELFTSPGVTASMQAEARKVIEEHRDDLILIANTLLERESITAEQIDYLLKYRTLDVFPAEPQQNAEILEDVTPIEPNSGDVIDE